FRKKLAEAALQQRVHDLGHYIYDTMKHKNSGIFHRLSSPFWKIRLQKDLKPRSNFLLVLYS
ncbi:MAG: hypothetical protein ACE5Q5_08090, partial [Nitrosarchaeum sp.]